MRDVVLVLLRQGMRPIQIASRLSLPYEAVHEIAFSSGIRYPGKHMTEAEKAEVKRLRELEGLPIRAIALRIGVSKTTVGNFSRRQFLKVQSQGGDEVAPEFLKVPKRCPRHGLVRLWPCVACAADPM
jgi:hypothetical protein